MTPSTYDVILADPPWKFTTWSAKGQGRAPKYNLMSLEEIKELPVRQLVGKHAALFLWVTWPHLQNAFGVMEAWGFTYRTNAWVWKKDRIAKGYYTRKRTEICLLGVRGSMPVAEKGIDDLLPAPVRKIHSQKPNGQYVKIERLYPNMRYLELFAREQRQGWDVWGDEIESDPHVKTILEGQHVAS